MAPSMIVPAPLPVDIGVFAHNEAAGIAAMLADLAAQDVWDDTALDLRLIVLANGCTDATPEAARAALAAAPRLAGRAEVADLPEGGKSRTWNRFVHDLARPNAAVLIPCDADIALPDRTTLSRLLAALAARPELAAVSSRPVKDIVHAPGPLPPVARLIAAAGGTLDDWRSAICGQLYAIRAKVARGFHLPVGLPVEDGFVRAMVLTGVFRGPEDFTRLDGAEGAFHVYASERRLGPLIRHQVRIVIGGAVNEAAFAAIVAANENGGPDAGAALLARAAADPAWLGRALAARRPAWPDLWVPAHFATKRLRRPPGGLRRLPVLVLGAGFDVLVYLLAQWRMARGAGVGYW